MQTRSKSKQYFYLSKNGGTGRLLRYPTGRAPLQIKDKTTGDELRLLKEDKEWWFGTSDYGNKTESKIYALQNVYEKYKATEIYNIVKSNIRLIKNQSGPTNLSYWGNAMSKLVYKAKKPITIKDVNAFSTNISKNLKHGKTSGKLYLICNFEGIGWRSSKAIDFGDKVKAYDPNDYEEYHEINDKLNFNLLISDFYIVYHS